MRKMLMTMAMIVAVTLLPGGMVFADATQPSGIPGGSGLSGLYSSVDYIDHRGHRIVINDQEHLVADYVIVHDANNKAVSLKGLKVGDMVSFATTQQRVEDKPIIVEIWIQPASTSKN